jgi:hypothetical protein
VERDLRLHGWFEAVVIPIREKNANNFLLAVRPELVEGSLWFDKLTTTGY